jgi:radical SAM superfamily enzyme YgiQ (UPF0313 family)
VRIGLLAMSGIRACDPELVAAGLTLPGFVRRSRVIASLPSLGLLSLAAHTPVGHDLRYFEAEGDGAEPPEVFDCDLVAISTFSAQAREAYAVADRLRAAGVRTAMGGLHASVCPEEAAAHVDYVVVGEGENVWPAVVNAAARGESGRVLRAVDFPAVDVAALPPPRYDLLRGMRHNRITVQTSRGCPWRCDFCASSVMLGQGYRLRPVEHVLRDIRSAQAVAPRLFVEFADDNTFVNKPWGRALCRALEPLAIPWFAETDISVADDPELLRLLRPAGCRQLLIGLESPEAEETRGLELVADFKSRRAGSALDAVRRIQDAGVSVNGCFILGLDGHTPDIFPRVLDFARRAGLYDVQVTVLTPFPGTPLYERLAREGRLLHPGDWSRCTLFDVNYRPARMTVEELRQGLLWLCRELYSAPATQARRRGFLRRRAAHRRAECNLHAPISAS